MSRSRAHHGKDDHPLNLSHETNHPQPTYMNDEDDNESPLDLSVKRFNTLQQLNTLRTSIFHLLHPFLGHSFPFLNTSQHHPLLLSSGYIPNGHHPNNFHFPPSFIPPPFPTSKKESSRDSREDVDDEDEDDEMEETESDDGQPVETSGQTVVLTDRKRITRPLTGRYVRNGTGASPSTLVKLRQVIMEKMVSPSQPKVARRSRTNKKKTVQSKRVQLLKK